MMDEKLKLIFMIVILPLAVALFIYWNWGSVKPPEPSLSQPVHVPAVKYPVAPDQQKPTVNENYHGKG